MEPLYLVTFFVTFIASILSGIAGGGVGFVTTPFWLAIGLSPAQGGAAGAFMATGMSLSSVAAFRKSGHMPKNKRLLAILSVVTFLAAITGVIIVPTIDVRLFKHALAVITIAALPLLFIKPKGKFHLGKHTRTGLVLAVVLLAIGSIITSSAFSILFSLTLMAFFGLSVLQTTAMKRLLYFVQSVVLLVGFTIGGYLIWQHAVAGFLGGTLGAYIGTKYAVKKGETFAKYALAFTSLIGAITLLM